MKLPKEINYAEAYLTLRCNLGCSYCINNWDNLGRKRKELSGDDWIESLNQIDFGDVPLTLGGGEPTLHKDFFKIINGIKKDTKIDLLTNLQFNIDEFIQKVDPDKFTNNRNPAYKPIRISYHAEQMDANELISKTKKLQNHGYKVGVFGLNHPQNIKANMHMSELARQNQIYFFVKDFLGFYNNELYGHYKDFLGFSDRNKYPEGLDGIEKKVQCRSKELLISPTGNVHRCHRDLYHAENPISKIGSLEEKDLYIFRNCNHYGQCNPCDLKLKTNRFLQMGNCQVEIK